MKSQRPEVDATVARPSENARKVSLPDAEPTIGDKNMAKTIRAVYIEDRSGYETTKRGTPFVYHPPKSYDDGTVALVIDGEKMRANRPSVWLTLACKFRDYGYDPVDYIHRCFEAPRQAFRRPPEPPQLLTDERRAYYRHATQEEGEKIADAFAIQCETAATEISYRQHISKMDFVRSHATVLLDPDIELSALFRYCLACQCVGRDPVFETIARTYARRAAVQFERNREHYLESWKDYLPADFLRLAPALYQSYLTSLAEGETSAD